MVAVFSIFCLLHKQATEAKGAGLGLGAPW